ncbi:hypothetical protein NMY22_g13264 [Coprinellus aureogranulatus]|nr:hypothetical protein NMY22_g13264 [Coprinellus aureogranulatus]
MEGLLGVGLESCALRKTSTLVILGGVEWALEYHASYKRNQVILNENCTIAVHSLDPLRHLIQNMNSQNADSSGKKTVSSVKRTLHSVSRTITGALGSSEDKAVRRAAPSPGDKLPGYEREEPSKITIDSNISYDAPDTVGRDLAYHLTGTNGHTPDAQPNLVIGPDERSLTLQERFTFVEKYLGELDALTANAPLGGYPPHSAELFKSAQLLKTIIVLTNVKAPSVPASKEYFEKIDRLSAIHGNMLERERELAKGEELSP